MDSLWGVWNNLTQPDTNRLEAMGSIAWYGYLFSQPDSAFYYAQKQFDLAKKGGHKKYMAQAYFIQGYSHSNRGASDSAIAYYEKNLEINEEINDQKAIGKALNNLGDAYKVKGDFNLAQQYFMKSLKIGQDIGDLSRVAGSYNNLGILSYDQGKYADAIEFYNNSLKIKEDMQNQKGMISTYLNIGNVYLAQEMFELATQYANKSLNLAEELGLKRKVNSALTNLGIIQYLQKNYDLAFEYHSKSLKLSKELGDAVGIIRASINIGNVYLTTEKYDLASEYYNLSLETAKEIGDNMGIALSFLNLAEVANDLGRYEKVIEHAEKALTIGQEIGLARIILDASELLWNANKQLGYHKKSLESYELYVSTRDTINSEENQKAVIRQEYKYQYEKQAALDSIEHAKAQQLEAAERAEAEARADAKLDKQKAKVKQKKVEQYALFGGLALLFIFTGFIFNRFRMTKKQKEVIEEQKLVVETQKAKVDEAYGQLEEKNTEILDSINYARRIQSAILPPNKLVKDCLPNSFVLYKPKDIVAGDFYWCEPQEGRTLFAAADCTGHGVPGAMVSVVCNNGLNRSVREFELTDPGEILTKTREIVISEFEKSEEEVKDGMDVALCSLEDKMLKYAGAHNPLWIIRKDSTELVEVKAHKQPIGKYSDPSPFPTHTIELNEGDSFYIFSDGFADQFGGERGKKFKTANFKRLLLSIQNETIDRQKVLIDETFEAWKGHIEQLDDVCVIGVRV